MPSKKIARVVPAIPMVMSKLEILRKQLTSAKTYAEIKRIEREAEGIKLLFREITEVKNKAEIVILIANRRIAEEMRKVPPAPRGLSKIDSAVNFRKLGKAATGVSYWARSRLGKLLKLTEKQLESRAIEISKRGWRRDAKCCRNNTEIGPHKRPACGLRCSCRARWEGPRSCCACQIRAEVFDYLRRPALGRCDL